MSLPTRPLRLLLLGTALLAPSLSLAAPAGDEGACRRDDELNDKFGKFGIETAKEAIAFFNKLPELRAEAAPLLSSKDWGLSAMPLGCMFSDPLTGIRLGKTAYMDLRQIVAAKDEAEDFKIAKSRIVRFVAWWQLPTIIHEFNHIYRQRLLAARGLHCEMATLEGEVLARHAEARALRALERRSPGIFKESAAMTHGQQRYADVAAAYKKGPAAMLEDARSDSPGLPFIQRSTHGDALERLAGGERESDVPAPPGPDEWANRRIILRRMTAAIGDVCRAELKDPKKFEAYKKALSEMLAEEARRWRRDNPGAKEEEPFFKD